MHAFAERFIDAALAHVRRNVASDSETNNIALKPTAQRPRPIILLELAKHSVTSGTDRTHLRNQLLGVFLGGHDSTSTLVANALFLLSRNPAT